MKNETDIGERTPPVSGWSLSTKILLALTLALLPMGLLAAILSIGNLRSVRNADMTRIEREASTLARGANDVLADYGLVLRTLVVQQADTLEARDDCGEELDRIARADTAFASLLRVNPVGVPLCASTGGPLPSRAEIERAMESTADTSPLSSQVFFDRSRTNIVYAVRDDSSRVGDTIIALMPVELLRQRFDALGRAEGTRFRVLVASRGAEPQIGPASPVEAERIVGGLFGTERYGATVGTDLPGLTIRYERPLRPLDVGSIATIAAPFAMWLVALLIAWFAARRLVVLPLTRMRRGIELRGAGADDVRLLSLSGDTQELAAFAGAFDRLSEEQAADRKSRQAALEAQERLMREVHHRVKNNLQIIASLLSVQARDTDDDELSRAYGVIQMRVNALSLVHRWLFEDDLERGVDFGSLAHDLVSSLEASVASVNGIDVAIHAEIGRAYVTQDAAVPLSFLMTEIVAAAGALARETGRLDIDIRLANNCDDGIVTIESAVLKGDDPLDRSTGTASARITHGMARQIRGELSYDAAGRYTLEFPLASVPRPRADAAE